MLDLECKVIYEDRCTLCGACATACEKITMNVETEIPTPDGMCKSSCEVCLDVCPRHSLDIESIERSVFGEQRTDNVFGVYKKTASARSKDTDIAKNAQSGGFVSSLLISALEEGTIDCAVVTSSDFTKGDRPKPAVVNSKEGILAASKSKYTPVPILLGLRQAIEQGYQKIGIVGLPCHIEGLRKLQGSHFNINGIDRVSLAIGLFCSKSFSYNQFMETSRTKVGNEEITKFDMKGKNFYIFSDKDTHAIPLKELDSSARNACKYCIDYTAELADISAGSIGSPDGFSSVIIKSDSGLQAVNSAVENGYIEIQDIESTGLEKIRQQAKKKRKAGFKKIISRISPLKLMHLIVNKSQLQIDPLLE